MRVLMTPDPVADTLQPAARQLLADARQVMAAVASPRDAAVHPAAVISLALQSILREAHGQDVDLVDILTGLGVTAGASCHTTGLGPRAMAQILAAATRAMETTPETPTHGSA